MSARRTYLVECYWPGSAEEEAARFTLEEVDRLAGDQPPGRAIRSLGCVLLPADGVVLFLFEAPDEASLQRVGRDMDVPFDRIVESTYLAPEEVPSRAGPAREG